MTCVEYHVGEEAMEMAVKESFDIISGHIKDSPEDTYSAWMPLTTNEGARWSVRLDRIDSYYEIDDPVI